jgi:hypothetical protein
MGSGEFTFKGMVMYCGKMTSVKGNIFKLTRSGKLEKNRIVRQDKLELHSILFQPQWMQTRMPKSPQPTLAIVPRTAGTMKKVPESYNCFPALLLLHLNICKNKCASSASQCSALPSNNLKSRTLYISHNPYCPTVPSFLN